VVILIVRERRAAAFTKTAFDGGRRTGLTVSEMVNVVCRLTSRRLYKSMTTYKDGSIWQDTHQAETPARKADVKLTLRPDGAPVDPVQRFGAMTRICVCREAGAEMVPFKGETHQIDYRGQSLDVDGLSGFRCPACGDIEFDAERPSWRIGGATSPSARIKPTPETNSELDNPWG
jgi:motility quorum-sensing regulator/GCU-specific mRNA interferase toxin